MAQARPVPAQGPRLAPGLVASLVLHAALAAGLRGSASAPARPRPTPIELAVVPRPPPPPTPELVEPTVTPAPPPAPRRPPRAASAPAPRPTPATRPPDEAPAPVDEPPPAPVPGLPEPAAGEGVAVAQGDGLGAAPGEASGPRGSSPAGGTGDGRGSGAGASGGEAQGGFAPVPLSAVRKMPGILREIQAPYPERARLLEIEGTVLLSVGVDAEGRTREVRLLRGIGHGLDEAAMQALREFRWSPAIGHDGRPVAIRLTYSYRFRVPR